MSITNYKWKVSQNVSRLNTNREYKYVRGLIVTKLGYASVYAEWGNEDIELGFMKNGIEYRRFFSNKVWTERGLSILAGKFAKEISNL